MTRDRLHNDAPIERSAQTRTFSTENSDDGRLAKALEAYLALCDAGGTPNREAFLAEHAEIADSLRMALDGLEFVRQFAPQLEDHSTSGSSSGPTDPITPRQLGDFRIIREIGRGGMGIVYQAEQISLGRQVAVKVLPWTGMLSTVQLQRFKNEAQSAASLHHPNIVNAFFVGQERGVHFYAMRYVEGKNLAEVITDYTQADRGEPETSEPRKVPNASETLPIAALSTSRETNRREFHRSVASLGIQAAEALHYAHSVGIVHRDIKPSNLLIDHDAHLWVTDFGLASTQTDATMTMSGDLLGTLRYMSPEQVAGESGFIDHRTDIYSLGVTLYELLTGQSAVPGTDRFQLMRNLDRELIAPITLDPSIPRDLNNVVLKATSRRPFDRYESAAELREDLQRFLDHKPIKARRIGPMARVLRWAQRRPIQATLATVALTLAAILAIGGPWTALVMDQKVRELRQHNYSLAVASAYQSWNESRLTDVHLNLHTVDSSTLEAVRGFEWDHLAGRLDRALEVPTGYAPYVWKVIRSPDGKRIVSACGDGTIRSWDPHDLTLLDSVKAHDGAVTSIEYSPDRQLLVSASGKDGCVKLWSAASMEPLATFNEHAAVWAGFSPDGRLFVTPGDDDRPVIWTLRKIGTTWERVKLATAEHTIGSWDGRFCFSPDSQTLVTYSRSSRPRVWRLSLRDADELSLELVRELPTTWADVSSAAFSESGDQLATAGRGLELWDTTTWEVQAVLDTNTHCEAVIFSGPHSLLTAGVEPIRVWNLTSPGTFQQIPAHVRGITSLVVSPDGESVVASCGDGTIRRFRLDSPLPRRKPAGSVGKYLAFCSTDGSRSLNSVAIMIQRGDGREFATSLDLVDLKRGERTNLFQLRSGRKCWQLISNPKRPEVIAFVCSASGGESASVDLWDVRTRKKFWSPATERAEGVGGMAFSNSGRLLALTGSHGSPLKGKGFAVWDIQTRKRLHQSTELGGRGIAFSHDDRYLIVGGGSWSRGRCDVVEVGSWERQGGWLLGTHLALSTQFSQSGRILATTGHTGGFRAFSWPNRTVLIEGNQFRGRSNKHTLTISPDDLTVVVAAEDYIEFWRTDTGRLVGRLQTPDQAGAPHFSPDGQRLLWVGDNGALHIWYRDGRTQVVPR